MSGGVGTNRTGLNRKHNRRARLAERCGGQGWIRTVASDDGARGEVESLAVVLKAEFAERQRRVIGIGDLHGDDGSWLALRVNEVLAAIVNAVLTVGQTNARRHDSRAARRLNRGVPLDLVEVGLRIDEAAEDLHDERLLLHAEVETIGQVGILHRVGSRWEEACGIDHRRHRVERTVDGNAGGSDGDGFIARAIDVGREARDHAAGPAEVHLAIAVVRLVGSRASGVGAGEGQRRLEKPSEILPPLERGERVALQGRRAIAVAIDGDVHGLAQVDLELLSFPLGSIGVLECCVFRSGSQRNSAAGVEIVEGLFVVRRRPQCWRRVVVARAVVERELAAAVDEQLARIELIEVLVALLALRR